jgi:purine-binding chemotaxis protein CheW
VIDAAHLLTNVSGVQPGRFVTVSVGDRRVALAVDDVVGVRHLPEASLRQLPPLLQELDGALVTTIAALDAELVLVLEGMRLVPDDLWPVLDRGDVS